MKTLAFVLTAAALAAALASPAEAGFPQPLGYDSAVIAQDCDYDCLIGFTHRYLDAMVHKDLSRAPFAKDVKFSENSVVMPLGNDGLWGTDVTVSDKGMTAADTQTGNAAWMGTVVENGAPAYLALRIKVEHHEITQVETVVQYKGGPPAPFGDISKVEHDPSFAEILPEDQRRGRERLRDIASGYFSTLSRNDGQILTHFDPDCQRLENGISTTKGSFGSAALAQGCEAQFKLGYFHINKRVRERRFPIIDTKRGVVVATGFLDHDNSFDTYKTTDGKTQHTFLKWPNSLCLMEAFKIRNGQIYRIEAIFTYVPYFMPSPWASLDEDSE